MRYAMRKGGGSLLSGASVCQNAPGRNRGPNPALDGSGKCDACLTGDAADMVWGALFEIADIERARLDAAEGLGRGYRDTQVRVETAHGTLTAFAYVATPDAVDATLAPFGWYRDLVVAGARESALPDRYISALAAVTTVADPDEERARRHRRLLGGGDALTT